MSAGLSATYVSATQFTVSGDYTAEFMVNRRVKADNGVDGTDESYVTAQSYDAGADETTVTLNDSILTSNLATVWFGVNASGKGAALPVHDHSDNDSGGVVDATNLQNLDVVEASVNEVLFGNLSIGTSWGDSDLTLSIDTHAGDVLVINVSLSVFDPGQMYVEYRIDIDGSAYCGRSSYNQSDQDQILPINLSHMVEGLSAGTHNVKLQWRAGGSGCEARGSRSIYAYTLAQ
jgi:hypothetical protein